MSERAAVSGTRLRGTTTQCPGPLPASARMLAPDLARGAMLLLIVLAHAPLYLVGVDHGVLNHPGGGSALDQATRVLTVLTVDNRAYPMFAALFGYGLVTIISRRQDSDGGDGDARRLIRRRGWWLLAFGLAHALLVTPVEILGAYGLATLLVGGLFFRREHTQWIAIAVLALWFLCAITAYSLAAGGDTGADSDMFSPGVLGYGFADMIGRMVGWMFAVLTNNLVFPIVIAMLLGGWAARRRILHDPTRHLSLLRNTALIGLPVSLAGATPIALMELGFRPASPSWQATALHIATGVCGGLAYTAVFGLLGARLQDRQNRLTWFLGAVGRRSLTCYLLQSALLVAMLSQTFVGLGGHVNSAGAALVATVAWLLSASAAALLERAGRPGPADALLRRLVYGRAQTPSGASPRDGGLVTPSARAAP